MRVDDLPTPAFVVDAGARVRLVPARVDPTMAIHATAWLVDVDDVLEPGSVDLRGWD